jgi:hypothetical protein
VFYQIILFGYFFFIIREISLRVLVLNSSVLNLQTELELLKTKIEAIPSIVDMPVITLVSQSSYIGGSLYFVPFIIFVVVVSVSFFSSVYVLSVSTTSSIYINFNLNFKSNNSLDLILVPSSFIENHNPFFDMILGMMSEPSYLD